MTTPKQIAYWKPFEAASVERTLVDHGTGCVIAFGAGQGIHDDPPLADRVRRALAAASAVVLLKVAVAVSCALDGSDPSLEPRGRGEGL